MQHYLIVCFDKEVDRASMARRGVEDTVIPHLERFVKAPFYLDTVRRDEKGVDAVSRPESSHT